MTEATTKQGRYLARSIRVGITINPDTHPQIAADIQRITAHHKGNQADAVRTAIALYANMLQDAPSALNQSFEDAIEHGHSTMIVNDDGSISLATPP